MLYFDIEEPDFAILPSLQEKINTKTKPVGALGRLEGIAIQIGMIQRTLTPSLQKPHFFVFAADHGLAQSRVSQYPQEVTYQMVKNFLHGGAAINVFCKQHQIALTVVDAGVKGDFYEKCQNFLKLKVNQGTKNMLYDDAMTEEECVRAIEQGSRVVREVIHQGTNIIGLGEMGIGNTSSAALILHVLTDNPLDDCVGRGTGLTPEGLKNKKNILKQVLAKHPRVKDPFEVLRVFGGFEIAHIVGAMLEAAQHKAVILVDGFITTSAAMIAHALYPQVLEYMLFSHQSDEFAHSYMLEYLKVMPILTLGMRLGEGTGAALAYPLVESAVRFLNEMASFDTANVSKSIE